ncbi:MAG: Light-independent protochlorophyllide reductase subunit B [Methanoregula sp. SKADARSKE-2]|nr:MAG: Light-independent protochlorophyllide reductase subunit B [Methanoregula sp. SKADARSKE-2]
MNLRPLQSNSCRHGGCTLTGALSATTHVRDAVTVVHGPKGCAHHNFSLLHTTGLDNGELILPEIISTGLAETEIIFGGEEALAGVLTSVARQDPAAVFVLTTCIVDTIGDDVQEVCGRDYGVPIIRVPTAGFLGGTFQDGMNRALCAIAATVPSRRADSAASRAMGPCVNIIGEKNLEFEVEENYAEVCRLLDGLDLRVNVRCIRNCTLQDLSRLGMARLNILRDEELRPVGDFLKERFGTPYVISYPAGLEGTIGFLQSVADGCGVPGEGAIDREEEIQREILAGFQDIAGSEILMESSPGSPEALLVAGELVRRLALKPGAGGIRVPLPISPPVGSAGVRRLLHRWRCTIHA